MGAMERLLDIRSVCLMSADNCVGWWGLEVWEVCMLIDLACCLTDAVICGTQAKDQSVTIRRMLLSIEEVKSG